MVTDARPVGLVAVLLSEADLDRIRWSVRWRSDPPKREVAFTLETLIWDGKAFKVEVHPGSLRRAEHQVQL